MSVDADLGPEVLRADLRMAPGVAAASDWGVFVEAVVVRDVGAGEARQEPTPPPTRHSRAAWVSLIPPPPPHTHTVHMGCRPQKTRANRIM